MDDATRKALFDQLRTLLASYSDIFEVSESPGKYSLSTTKPIIVDGKEHSEGYYFAGLRENKNIVGFYFMPIYMIPELRDRVPGPIANILKGNTCFNVKKLNPEMAEAFRELMNVGIQTYRNQDWI